MNEEASRYFDAISELLHNSACTCSECGTAFCVSKRDHESQSCKECKNCKPSSFYFGKESILNTAKIADNIKSSALKFIGLEDSTEIASKALCKQSLKSGSAISDKDFHIVKVSKEQDTQKNMSTTTAQLSAQIMNVSYKEYKESVSHVGTEKCTYNTNDIFKRIKEAYDACSCKICECITGKSILPPNDDSCGCGPCRCEPCNCKDCQNDLLNIGIDPRIRYYKKPNTVLERIKIGFTKQDDDSRCSCKPCDCDACTYKNLKKDFLNIGLVDSRLPSMPKSNTEIEQINRGLIESTDCDCKPCDCINCYKKYSTPCDCKPCQCYECKSMRVFAKKTVIVAPVGEGTQRANCLCAPCDCARCSHRGLNLSPNRVHEMSTGINRHPNCHCEACVDDSCEPNGTGSCRCEGRHGVISKPVENNPHDYDIRRATVSSKPMTSSLENRFVRNSTFVAMNINKFPSGNSKDFNNQSCKCGICECVVCKCKGNDFGISKSSQNFDDSLKTIKLPSRELKNCQCSPCECEYCTMKKQAHFSESTDLKSCTCENCECLHCEGQLKPRHTLSKLIPVMGTGSREMCRCKPCECNDCKKMVTPRNANTCHCDICQCEHCADESNASHEALYPIKKGEILTPSMIRKDPLSEPELLRQSSEYTHLKHSMAQSNVFNQSRMPERSQQNFTIYHMVPESKIRQSSFSPAVPVKLVLNQRKLDSDTKSKSRKAKILDPSKEELKNWNQFYCASTSKTVSGNGPLTVGINTSAWDENDKMSFDDDMLAISKLCRIPSLLSIPQSAHNLVYLTPTSESYQRTDCQLSISSSNKKAENSKRSLRNQKEIHYDNGSTETRSLEQNRYHHCGSTYVRSELTSNEITQTPFHNITNYNGNNSVYEDPILKCLLSDHSDSSGDNIPRQVKNHDNRDDENYGSHNQYHAWRFEYPNSRSYSVNNVDKPLFNRSAPYETALKTLQRAKEFSHELVALLHKYEKANIEFESISKKLKKSHESILKDFKYDIYGRSYKNTSSLENDYDHMNSSNDVSETIFDNSKESKMNEQFSSHNKEYLKDNYSLPLIVENHRKLPDDKGSTLKEFNEFRTSIKKNSLNKPITPTMADPQFAIHVNLLEKKSSKQLINSNNANDLATADPHEGTVTKLLPTIDTKIELQDKPDKMIHSPNGYRAYKKLVKRSANIARKCNQKDSTTIPVDNGCDALPINILKTVETDLLKAIVRQEIKSILKKYGDIKKTPTSSSYTSAEETKAKNVIKRKKRITIKYDEPDAERPRQNIKLTENKPIIKGKGSIIHAANHEATDPSKCTQNHTTAEESSSQKRNKPLEILQKVVKELLNMTMLKTASTDDVIQNPPKESSPIRSRSAMDTQPAAPAVYNIDKQKTAESISKSKLTPSQSSPVQSLYGLRRTISTNPCPTYGSLRNDQKKCICDGMKATFLGLRRVSDHTVMVKWQAPKNIQNIKGFEVLVDGKPVEKFFGPSDRMAVVTCLPNCERVQLAVRSVCRMPCVCGQDACRTALYRPRDK